MVQRLHVAAVRNPPDHDFAQPRAPDCTAPHWSQMRPLSPTRSGLANFHCHACHDGHLPGMNARRSQALSDTLHPKMQMART